MSIEPIQVRQSLLDALQVDLIGPSGTLGDPREVLPQAPSRWYLTGFLVPTDADEEQRFDPNSDDDVDQAPAVAGVDENAEPEKSAARRSYLPSSLGLSVLIPAETRELQAIIRFGEYLRVEQDEGSKQGSPVQWRRNPHEEIVSVALGSKIPAQGVVEVPGSRGVEIAWSLRGVPDGDVEGGLPKGTRSLSMFVVNRRKASPDEVRDEGFIFQVELEVQSDTSFIARPNLHSLESDDWDERVSDLQYRHSFEFSVGHSVATESVIEPNSARNASEWIEGKVTRLRFGLVLEVQCKTVRTCHLPTAEVEKVAPSRIDDVTLNMETLAFLRDGNDAIEQLGGFASSYRDWIEKQSAGLSGLSPRRMETAKELLHRAGVAANRIQAGIDLLADPDCLEAFRIANKTMAAQGRRRLALQLNMAPEEITPAWRPFQLAFILMNLLPPQSGSQSLRSLPARVIGQRSFCERQGASRRYVAVYTGG